VAAGFRPTLLSALAGWLERERHRRRDDDDGREMESGRRREVGGDSNGGAGLKIRNFSGVWCSVCPPALLFLYPLPAHARTSTALLFHPTHASLTHSLSPAAAAALFIASHAAPLRV
jgi:hypothetical protein